jgi:hypothetical protein
MIHTRDLTEESQYQSSYHSYATETIVHHTHQRSRLRDLTYDDKIVRIANIKAPSTKPYAARTPPHPRLSMPVEEIPLPDGYEYCTTEGHQRQHVATA